MKNRYRYNLLVHLLSTGLLLLTVCTVNTVDNGGSSGTEISEATGTATDRGGNPVSDAIVRLRPSEFLADSTDNSEYLATHTIIDTITGSDGSFLVGDLKEDTYYIEVTRGDTLGCVTEVRIDSQGTRAELPAIILEPMSEIIGHIDLGYSRGVSVTVKVRGLERSTTADSMGNFSLKVPGGKHQIHIGAMFEAPGDTGEFDGLDITIAVYPGEQRFAGSFKFRPPPPEPCADGACDSSVVQDILEKAGLATASFDSITEAKNGRIVALNLRGHDLSDGISYEVNRLSALRLLDLGNTGLPDMFPDIGTLTELETVRLDSNALEFFSTTAGKLEKLRELDLSDNRLVTLYMSLLNCRGIEMIDVGNNRLCLLEPAISEWLDDIDPDWSETQRCK